MIELNLSAKTTPVDADSVQIVDSADLDKTKRTTWANVKATLKTYFDTLYQALNSNLTTIAGLTATTDNFIVSVASAWASRTPAQVKTTLSLNNVDNTSDSTKNSASATLSNKKMSLTAAHGSDDTYEGLQITGLNAGATIAQWDAVYLGGSSTWLLADANGSSTYPARGLAVAAYSNTNPAIILVRGTVRNDAWAWTPGGTIYLSTTAGGLTQTAPTGSGDKIQAVGFALTADIAFFDFNSLYLTKS